MYQYLKSLTFALVLTSSLYAAEKAKTQKTKEMQQVENLFLKLDKSAQETYISKLNGEKELRELHKAFREQQVKFSARSLLLEKQLDKRIKFLKDKNINNFENDEVIKKITKEINYITLMSNRLLQNAWKVFVGSSPDLSVRLLHNFEKNRLNITATASVVLLLFKDIEKVSEDDNVALELILDIGRIPSSAIERPALRQFSFKAQEASPNFDLVHFLVSAAISANEIVSPD